MRMYEEFVSDKKLKTTGSTELINIYFYLINFIEDALNDTGLKIEMNIHTNNRGNHKETSFYYPKWPDREICALRLLEHHSSIEIFFFNKTNINTDERISIRVNDIMEYLYSLYKYPDPFNTHYLNDVAVHFSIDPRRELVDNITLDGLKKFIPRSRATKQFDL